MWTDFQNSLSTDSYENSLCKHHNDFHRTCNILLHYLVNDDRMFLQINWWKNFENRSTLAKVIIKHHGVYFILRHSVYVDNGSKGLWHLNKLSLRTAQWLLAGRHHELKNLTHFSHKNYEIFWKWENSILSSGAIVCFGLLFETS